MSSERRKITAYVISFNEARQIRAVLDVCQQANIPKVDLATEAANQK